ncbi:hypothetical protein SAMD00019534_045360, partial [Acytostelium subglobosum LB1]|uniref:hypothetical protein n=1 Tax=Acytostelium subglobosum LB1 TaxID=1410327 RepID=UPI000644838B
HNYNTTITTTNKMRKSISVNDSYDEDNIVVDDEDVDVDVQQQPKQQQQQQQGGGDDDAFADEFDDDEDEDDDDGDSKKRKRKSTSGSSSSSTAKPTKQQTVQQLPYQDRVFVLYDKLIDSNDIDDEASYTVLSLLNPKTKSRYMFDKRTQLILEINNFRQRPSSWFMDNSVRHDGSLYCTSPIDPLFLIIPYLERAKERANQSSKAVEYVEPSQMMCEPQFQQLKDAGFVVDDSQLELICDHTTLSDRKLYALNTDKMMLWLKCKVEQMRKHLYDTNTNTYRASAIQSKSASDTPHEIWLQMALDFVGEYLAEGLLASLKQHLGYASKVHDPHSIIHSLIQSFNQSRLIKTAAAKTVTSADTLNYNERVIEQQFNLGVATKKKKPISVVKSKLLAASAKQTSKISDFFTK